MLMHVDVLVLAPSRRELEGVLPIEHKMITIAGKQVFSQCIGVGKVLSALNAQKAIMTYNPSLVVLVGYCGALVQSLDILDPVLAIEVKQYDLDLCAFGLQRGFTFDQHMHVVSGCCSLVAPPLTGFRQVVLGSADRFLLRSYRETHPFLTDEMCLQVSDMEGFSVALAASIHAVDCSILRVVSDDAQGRRPKKFSSFAREASKKLNQGLFQLLEEPREKSPTSL
ncbi:MAG: hypothetical protein EOM15_10190 [Spirochaetia bacterium]|nr:hypothetical protein [Spirochaetia bacterium]